MRSTTDFGSGVNNLVVPELLRSTRTLTREADEIYLSLGTLTNGSNAQFRPGVSQLNRHMMVAGGTRGGKSKLYEHLGRQLIDNGCGFAFIDPHSVSADELFAYLAYHYNELGFVRENIHYLNPKERLFAYDPFSIRGIGELSGFRYRAWLFNKIKAMVRIIVRQQGESEDEAAKMVRLRRWLYNGLYAVGVRDDDGNHLPLSDIFALLNPQHPRHEELYQHTRPFLDESVRNDFEKLRRTKSARQQEDWVESSFNRLREMLSPLVASIFDTQTRPTIDFTDIMRRNGVILASLGTDPQFDSDESHVLAGLMILELRDAAQATAQEARNNYYLWLDEAHHFLGEDLNKMLVESAKYRISIGLAFQDLTKLQRGTLDLLPTVISQCGIRISFQQQFHEHAEILGKSLCGRNYEFEPLFQIADRPDGHDLVLLQSATQGTSEEFSSQTGRSTTRGVGQSRTRSQSAAIGQSRSDGTTRQSGQTNTRQLSQGQNQTHTDGSTESTSSQHGSTASNSHSYGNGSSESMRNGDALNVTQGASSQHGQSSGESQSETYGSSNGVSSSDSHGTSRSQSAGVARSDQSGMSVSRGSTLTDTTGFSDADSTNFGISDSESNGHSTGRSQSQSVNQSLVARTREEWQLTGRLRNSIPDQTARFASVIMSLPQQHCLVSLATSPAFVVRVDDVFDPFEKAEFSTEARAAAIKHVKSLVYASHPYYFDPMIDGECSSKKNVPVLETEPLADDPNDPFAF